MDDDDLARQLEIRFRNLVGRVPSITARGRQHTLFGRRTVGPRSGLFNVAVRVESATPPRELVLQVTPLRG